MALDIIPLQIDGKVINIIEEDDKTIFVFRFYNKDGVNITPAQVIYSEEEEQIPELSTQIYYGVYIEPYEEDGDYIFKFVYLNNKYIAIVAEADYNNLRAGSIIEFTNIHLGTDTSDATATAEDILQGKTAYADGVKLTGTLIPFSIPTAPTDSILFYSFEPFTVGIVNKTKNWNGALYYSTDHETWTEWDGTTDIQAELSEWFYKIYLRGLNNTTLVGTSLQPKTKAFKIAGSGIKCIGNINRLLSYNIDILNFNTNYKNCFSELFYKCVTVDFDVELPATTVNEYCYKGMFEECYSITKAPELPATNLENYCYADMFKNCSSLKQAPELPATTLANHCYDSMFSGTSISSAPALPATSLANYCYNGMFRNCNNLIDAPALPATVLADYCYMIMFENCSLLNKLPELPATTLTKSCYQSMFSYCSAIKLSTTQTEEYQTEYRIPTTGTGTDGTNSLLTMLNYTGGPLKGTPSINTTYYTSNTVIPAST